MGVGKIITLADRLTQHLVVEGRGGWGGWEHESQVTNIWNHRVPKVTPGVPKGLQGSNILFRQVLTYRPNNPSI